MTDEPTINFQMLTPARLCWVLDIGESTEAAWRSRKRPVIPFFREGRFIRYKPADVLAAIASQTRRGAAPGQAAVANGDFEAWTRIERLVADQVRAQVDRLKEAA